MTTRITDRILYYAECKNLKNKDLATLFGVSPQFISDAKSGRSNLTDKQVLKFLLHNRDVDAHWVVHGEHLQKSGQLISGDYNTQAGNNITGDPSTLELENKYLKKIIEEKENQILLLKKMLK